MPGRALFFLGCIIFRRAGDIDINAIYAGRNNDDQTMDARMLAERDKTT